MSTDDTPDAADDPVREPALLAALRTVDRAHAVDAAAVTRLEQRLAASLVATRVSTRVSTRATGEPDQRAHDVGITSGLVLCLQQARRWVPITAVAAVAAVVVAVSMTPARTVSSSVSLVAYAGGRSGAALLADEALGLSITPAELLGQSVRQ